MYEKLLLDYNSKQKTGKQKGIAILHRGQPCQHSSLCKYSDLVVGGRGGGRLW